MHIFHTLDVLISILLPFIGHFSSFYSIFLDLIKYLSQPLDNAKLSLVTQSPPKPQNRFRSDFEEIISKTPHYPTHYFSPMSVRLSVNLENI